MPEIDWNVDCWGASYDWGGQGEEWSESWGGSDAQWFGAIYPRIHRFVHCNSILEIAPGFGRWTRFLLACAHSRYWGIDISKACIDACMSRFEKESKASFAVNDGKSLAAVGNDRFDFIFSFDSLVHADRTVFEQYIPQILGHLTDRGVAFIHHSNLAELIKNHGYSKKTPLEKRHYRDDSMSGPVLKALVEDSGGRVLIQESVNWGCGDLIDCFSLFCNGKVYQDIPFRMIANLRFMDEAENIKRHVAPYSF